MLTESITRNSILLGFFAALTTAIVAGTFLSTKDSIAENIRKAQEKALLELVPKDRHNNSMLDHTLIVDNDKLLGLRESKQLFIAKQDNNIVAAIIPVTARDGYTGDINMIVGINSDGTVAGVRILEHRETPGLGDAVDKRKSDWVDGFIGKSLTNPSQDKWKVKKDKGEFDQFTGATITPRAVTKAIKQALIYFEEHKQEILAPPPPSEQAPFLNIQQPASEKKTSKDHSHG